MKRNNGNPKFYLIGFTLLMIGISSCGIITKTRYGNGLKLNLEYGQKAHQPDTNYQKAIAARKAKRAQLKEKNYVQNSTLVKDHQPQKKSETSDQTDGTLASISLKKGSVVQSFTLQPVKSHPHASISAIDTTAPGTNKKVSPVQEMEEHAEMSGYIFYGSMIGYIISAFLGSLIIPELAVLGLVFGLGMLVGFIFAIIGLRKIKEAKEDRNVRLRGSGLAISVIVVYGLMALFALLYALIFLAIALAWL